jgi:MFS family permease
MSEANVVRTPGSARAAVRRLALGRVISSTGTFAAGTALTFAIFERTRSPAWISATLLLTWGVIGFFGPLAGLIGDRYDRRRVMIFGESGAAVCWLAMAFVPREPTLLLAIAFLSSVFEAPFFPASSAAIPNVAGKENISWANSLLATGRYLGLTVGPLIGGLLLAAIGASWVFAINAASYAFSVALVASVRADFADPERDAAEAAAHEGILAGFRFVRQDRVLRQMALSWIVFLLGMATTLVADPLLADEFGTGSFGFGMLTALWGGGTILGAYLGRWVSEDREAAWIVVFSFLVALTGFGVFFSPWFWLVLFWVFVFGVCDGPTQVVEQNLLQRRTPDVVRSRVMGAWDTLMHGGLVVALIVGGWIVEALGPKGAYLVGGITGTLGASLLVPLLRWLPRRSAAGAAERVPGSETVPFELPG